MNWLPIILPLLTFFSVGRCSPIQCINHYLYLQTNDDVHKSVCWGEDHLLTVQPSLPNGITFNNGIISGKPLIESPLQQYQVYNTTLVGFFWLSISKSVSYVSVGFSSRTIYIGSPFIPIRIFSDGTLANYTLIPSLENGLQLDSTKRIIQGIYTGSPGNRTYVLTAQSGNTFVSTSFTLYFTYPDTESHFLTYCTYTFESLAHQPVEWYEHSSPLQCSSLSSLSVSLFSPKLGARFVGYLKIPSEEDYFLNVNCVGGLVLRIDNHTLFNSPPLYTPRLNQTVSIFLARGYHLFEIIYVNVNSLGSLELFYKTPSTEWSIVDQRILREGGISPFNLFYKDIVTYIKHPIEPFLPFVNGCGCTKFVLPYLPAPLLFDSQTGVISGVPTNTSYNVFTLTCISEFGTADFSFFISIAVFPQPGVQVTYYDYRNSTVLTLLENTIDHPLVAAGIPWPSLPLYLFRGFTAQWEGLLYPKQDGRHCFRFVFSGGIRVWVEDVLILDYWNNTIPGFVYELPLSLLEKHFYALRIMYVCRGFESGIRFYMKLPGSSQYIIPGNEFLFSEIREEFRYTMKEMICVVNTTISSNNPLFNYHSATSFSFMIKPSLPKGLEMNNGVISGIPLEVMKSTEFTIQAIATEIQLTTTIMMEIQKSEVPSNLFIYDLLGHRLTSYSVYKYSFVSPLLLASSVSNVIWRVHPKLPEGFVLDNKSHRINGRALTVHPTTTFTFFAESTGGITSFDFPIEVKACEHGRFLYTSFSENSNGEFSLEGEGQQVNEKIIAGDYGIVLCLPAQMYRIRIYCSSKEPCIFRLMQEGELFMLMRDIPPYSWDEIEFDYASKHPPVIIPDRLDIATHVNTPFVYRFHIAYPFYSVVFIPSLPSSMSFDQTTLQVSGTVTSPSIIQFTVVAKNDYGTDERLLSVYVDECPQNRTMYQFSRKKSEIQESLMIMQQNTFIYSTQFMGQAFNISLCLSSDVYSITMEGNTDLGWAPGSDIVVRDLFNRLYGTFTLEPGKKKTIDSLDLAKLVAENTPMRYLISAIAPSSEWKLPLFDDSSWKISTFSQWETVPPSLSTVYFRQFVSVSKGSIAIHLLFKEGCVVYQSGIEIERFNLPEGTIYHSTQASSQFTKARWMTVHSPYYETQQTIIIAVEIHRFSVVSSTSIDFDLAITHNLSPQLLLSIDGVSTPAVLYRGSRQLAWIHDTPAMTSYSFNNNRRYPVNRVDIAIGPNFQWDVPCSISVWGDDTQLLKTFSRSLFHRPYETYSLHLPTSLAFNTYHIIINSSLNDRSMELRSIALYQSMEIYCAREDDWPTTKCGFTSQSICHGMYGRSKRMCFREGLEGIWGSAVNSECLNLMPSLGKVFFDTSLVLTNVTETIWEQRIQSVVETLLKGSIESKVTFLLFGDCSTEDNLKVEVGVRMEVHRMDKARMYQRLKDLQFTIQSEMDKQGFTMITTQFHVDIRIRDSFILLVFIFGFLFCVSLITFIIIMVRHSVHKKLKYHY